MNELVWQNIYVNCHLGQNKSPAAFFKPFWYTQPFLVVSCPFFYSFDCLCSFLHFPLILYEDNLYFTFEILVPLRHWDHSSSMYDFINEQFHCFTTFYNIGLRRLDMTIVSGPPQLIVAYEFNYSIALLLPRIWQYFWDLSHFRTYHWPVQKKTRVWKGKRKYQLPKIKRPAFFSSKLLKRYGYE